MLSLSKVVRFLFFIVLFTNCKSDDEDCCVAPSPPIQEGFLGQLDFIKTYGGSLEDDALSITKTSDGGYAVLGYTQSNDEDITAKTTTDSDYWVVKFDNEGNQLWDKVFGGSEDDRGQHIITTKDGGFLITGFARSNDGDVENNQGFYDYFFLKLDSSGNKQWVNSFGFSGSDRSFSAVELNDGDFFLTGFLDVTASDGEGNDNARPAAQQSASHGVGEFWGIRVDDSGNKIWRRYFGGTNNDRSYDVVQTNSGNILMVGSSESEDFDITQPNGSYDFWVVMIDIEGNLLWQKNYGGSGIDVGYAVTKTSDGNFVIVGDTRSSDIDVSSPLGNADAWVIKIDALGNLLWEKTYGGSDFDSAQSVSELENGDLLIAGNSKSNDGNLISNKGQNDAWVFITDGDGHLKWQKNFGGSSLDFINQAIELDNNQIILTGSTQSNDQDILENKGSKDILLIKLK
ncbi:hypothetical protein [Mesonia sp. K7]|uniref:hypothetical protein n=1 Tax=Mesonia sp. K7 TaxID=2218606 RepID=UPI000DA9885A|nr:hypothetical protein [Mesonia sp. K7]PZD78448.1 hypothetical protein DNG35_05140 [Mesonia sp. K7]